MKKLILTLMVLATVTVSNAELKNEIFPQPSINRQEQRQSVDDATGNSTSTNQTVSQERTLQVYWTDVNADAWTWDNGLNTGQEVIPLSRCRVIVNRATGSNVLLGTNTVRLLGVDYPRTRASKWIVATWLEWKSFKEANKWFTEPAPGPLKMRMGAGLSIRNKQ